MIRQFRYSRCRPLNLSRSVLSYNHRTFSLSLHPIRPDALFSKAFQGGLVGPCSALFIACSLSVLLCSVRFLLLFPLLPLPSWEEAARLPWPYTNSRSSLEVASCLVVRCPQKVASWSGCAVDRAASHSALREVQMVVLFEDLLTFGSLQSFERASRSALPAEHTLWRVLLWLVPCPF